jgi:pyrroloquinoline-quinone synthase
MVQDRDTAETFWERMDEVAHRHDVLRHPFYVRWSDGKLSAAELAEYSGQYRHAVIALAAASGLAARSPDAGLDAPVLFAHAVEEAAHILVWDQFLAQVDGDFEAEVTPETRACVDAWVGPPTRPLLERLVGLYAIESAQPEISAVKARALAKHHDIASVRYFELHCQRDVAHARALREQINRRLIGADEPALLDVARDVLRANWRLLDGVDRPAVDQPA